ncbi:WRKY family transcription factor [Quillaja saponaria]|uniref:WRKY family transcription factor n=1 Tax=Quillaja saponaria TaxID=32244 RepID=A0AAD7VFH0_QUISA|nr:WRKY family transcription factor [Quillaja saponaria]
MEDYSKNQSLILSSDLSGNAEMELVQGGAFSGFYPAGAKGSIAERRAAKCGFTFHAARINTARFRTTSPLASTMARSPCLTIPPGISPTALLDSPVLLPNSQALPSPTTGTFLLPPLSDEGSALTSATPDDGDLVSISGSSFRFSSSVNPNSLPCISSPENQVSDHSNIAKGGDASYQALYPVPLPFDFGFPVAFPKGNSTRNSEMEDSFTDVKRLDNAIISGGLDLQMCRSAVATGKSSKPSECTLSEDVGSHLVEGEQKGSIYSMGLMRTSEDGYNWRKYGQKQVKGSEYPRSYYKCTNPNCHVKKKVERSLDGEMTEIIYKGAHNHAKPQPNRRASLGSSFSTDKMSDMGEGNGNCVKVDDESDWRNSHSGSKDIKHSLDWKADGLERTSSKSVVTELSDPLSTVKGKLVGVFEATEAPELSSTLVSHDEDEDGATHGSVSLGDDCDDDESESKRRKKENSMIESNLASRSVREPRVVVQIESEVDILDDGYRWRKYGQKVVKGNPNPRSYYKCTSAGCAVRKHVERASHNLKFVITTYEGKHNHEVPTARNSSQISSSGSNVTPPASSQAALTLPGNTDTQKPEIQVQGLPLHFDRKPDFCNEFLRSSFVGNFSEDMKFGSSSIFQMKYPQLQNTMACAPVLPDFPISLPHNLPSSGDFPLTGFSFNNCVRPMGPVWSFPSGQQLEENDTRFLRPKREQKDDSIYDCPPIVGHANAPSLLSSVYHQVMGNFPP